MIFLSFTGWLEDHEIPCLWQSLFHMNCPGCGFQRASLLLIKGRFADSFLMYPALIPMLLFFLFLLADRKFRFPFTKKIIVPAVFTLFMIIFVSYIIKLTLH